jgi:uncharacterized membrane protein
MTGKEILIALALAGLVGGAAGAAASVSMSTKSAPVEPPSTELAGRLKSAEDELAKTRAALDESRRSIVELTERVTKSELAAAKLAATPAVAAPTVHAGSRFVRSRRDAAGTKAEDGKFDEVGPFFGAIEAQELPEAVTVELNDALDGIGAELGEAGVRLTSLRAGLDLRKLPEDQRWQKAKDDLGLTWNQVEDLKKAVSERDAAMKEASTVEKKTGPNGGTITISRPDAGKTAHAQAAYHDKVNSTLNDEQKKSWQSKGYDHAFGKGGFGGAMVMAVDVTREQTLQPGQPPKDSTK